MGGKGVEHCPGSSCCEDGDVEAFAVQCFDNILTRLNNSPKANPFSVTTGMEEKLSGVLGKSRSGSVSEGRFRIEHATESLVVLVFSFAGLMAHS